MLTRIDRASRGLLAVGLLFVVLGLMQGRIAFLGVGVAFIAVALARSRRAQGGGNRDLGI